MYGLFLQLGCRLCEALNPKYCLPPPYVSIELLPRHRAIDGRCNTCVIIIAQVRGLIIWSLEKPTGGTSLRAPKCSPSCKGIEILQHGVYMLDVLGLTFKASSIIGTSTKYELHKPWMLIESRTQASCACKCQSSTATFCGKFTVSIIKQRSKVFYSRAS